MVLVLKRLGLAMAAMVLAIGASDSALAEPITFRFSASDVFGRALSGSFSYDLDVQPGVIGGNGQVDFGEFRLPKLRVDFGGMHLNFPASGVLYAPFETVVIDADSGLQEPSIFDSFTISMFDPDSPSGFWLGLFDNEGTAFDTHLSLPSIFVLDQFELRSVSFQFRDLAFSGTIDSLDLAIGAGALVPEPSTLALCALSVPAGLLLARHRRRRSVPAAP